MPFLSHRAPGIRLGSVLRGSFVGADDVLCQACCADPSQCQPGDVYFAVGDAPIHDIALIEMAVQRGAQAVVVEQLVPTRVPVVVVANVRRDFAVVCNALAGAPQEQLPLIGVSGTSGKTVATTLIQSVLAAGKQPCAIMNSLWTGNGRERRRSVGLPSSPHINNWLSDALIAGCRAGVLEVASQGLVEHRYAGLTFDAAVLTNLGSDHLDIHNSLQGYQRCKRRLFELLRPEGVAILNADDRGSRPLIDELSHPTLTIGIHRSAELTAQVIERHMSEQTFLIRAGSNAIPVRTQIIGDEHVYRCLEAAAVGLAMNIPLEVVVKGLESVESIEGQMQRLECGLKFGTFIHHSPNPRSLASALKALKQVTTGRVICVFGASESRDSGQRAPLGRVAEKYADTRILTAADYSPFLGDYGIAHDVLDGFEQPSRAHLMPTRENAIERAVELAAPGDAILIASQEPVHDVDAEFVSQLLYELPARQTDQHRKTIRFPVGASLN